VRLTSSGVRLRGEVEVWVDVRLRGSQDLFKAGMNILQTNLEIINQEKGLSEVKFFKKTRKFENPKNYYLKTLNHKKTTNV